MVPIRRTVMAGIKRWATDLGYAAVCAAAVLGCLLVTADDLRADTTESCFSYCYRTTGGQGISDCISACCQADPSRCGGPVSCGAGNNDCKDYVTAGDCWPGEPSTTHQHNCNSNTNCHCRWRPVSGVDKCVCQNTTGGS
jgi:hypothetical protein